MTSRRFRVEIALLGILLVLLPAGARAQTGTASITGLVIDETGGALPGVTVTATNQATNVRTRGGHQRGRQLHHHAGDRRHLCHQGRAAGLPDLDHRADCARGAGRSRASTSRWASAPSPRPSQVTGVAPILQTETTTVGEVLSGNTVQSLPLNGRNTGQLALLLPGTVTYNPRGFTNIGSVNMNRPFVNGNREQTNNFTVDGLDVNETIDNRVAYQPIPDALAEISVETNNYAADVGNVGGAVDQQRDQVGHEPVSRQRVRVLPEQRLRREHVGEQPVGRAPSRSGSSTSTAARSAARSSANTLFFFGDYQGSRQDAPGLRHRVGGAGSVAPRRPVERDARRSAIR